MKEISRYRGVLMGFAALWIYCFHIIPVGLFARWPAALEAETFIHNEGFCGVDIFLLVSSFGLSYSLEKAPSIRPGDYGRYLLRRLGRIYRVMLPVTLVIGFVDNWSLREFLGKLTGAYQLGHNVYSFLWFLPCILLFYLFAPFYAALLRRTKHQGAVTAGAIVLVLVLEYALRGRVRVDLYAIFTRISVFLLGFYFGALSRKDKKTGPGGYLLAGAMLLAGLVYNYLLSKERAVWYLPDYNAQVNLLIAPALSLLLAKLCQTAGACPVPQWLGKVRHGVRVALEFFGSISLEFYAIQEWTWLKMQNSSTLLRLFGGTGLRAQMGCFGLVLLASVTVHHLAKLPARRAKIAAAGV